MRGLNKVTLIGNIQPADPELKYTPNGTEIENAEWHRIVAWGKLGETCNTYLKKGSRIYLDGRIRTPDTYEKEGKTVYPAAEIVMENLLMLDTKPYSSDSEKKETEETIENVSDKPNDDLPF